MSCGGGGDGDDTVASGGSSTATTDAAAEAAAAEAAAYSLCSESDVTCDKNWQPSQKTNCIVTENQSPSLPGYTRYLADSDIENNSKLFEPNILFWDQTLTAMVKNDSGSSTKKLSEITNISSDTFTVYGETNNDPLLYDNGTHGDITASDGVFTRGCLSLKTIPADIKIEETFDLWFLDPTYKGTETVTELMPGLRINDAGFFISVGDEYTNTGSASKWSLVNPATSKAMTAVWNAKGNVFDVFMYTYNIAAGGAGMWRLHDFIQGLNHGTTAPDYSRGYSYLDGLEHPELIAGIHIGWPTIQGATHELEHAMFGINTVDFPEAGNSGEFLKTREWTVDHMHIEADSTVQTTLKGPIWDPTTGHPVSVNLWDDDSKSERVDTQLESAEDGTFRLIERVSSSYQLSDIFLYMLGVIELNEANETYYKLINYKISENCDTTEGQVTCLKNDNLVTYDEVITFTTNDLVTKFGGYSNPRAGLFDPKNIQVGILHLSDRNHTDAEIVLKSKVYRSWSSSQDNGPKVKFDTQVLEDFLWSYITKGKSAVNIDFR